ncbi:MAG: secretin N-terminal domain-containing protein, partial [Planctomycetota bacterium]
QLDSLKEEDKYITLVYPLKYVSSTDTQQALSQSVAKEANMVAMAESNTLLISDFLPAVKEIVDVIRLMDIKPEAPDTAVVQLKYASAEDTVPKLEALLLEQEGSDPSRRPGRNVATGQPGQPGQIGPSSSPYGANRSSVKLVPDERINSIIIKAFPERMKEVKDLIQTLDQKQLFDTGIKVYELKHSDAEKLQEVIAELISAGNFNPDQSGGGTRPVTPGKTGGGSSDTKSTIVAEKQTNSLLFTGSKTQRDQIEELIRKLDVRRPQVLIEAAFVEITPTNVFNLGVELALIDNPHDGSTRGFGGTAFGLSTLVDETGTPVTAANPGIPVGRLPIPNDGSTFALTRGNAFTLPIILQMLEQTSDTKVLSTPRVLTNDNQQAHIKVSDAVPVVQFQTTDAGTDSTSFQEFEEAGTELKITPHIAADNYLRLDIEQIIEKFDFTVSAVASAPPPKTTRSLTTSITVPDGHTIVIGGLVGNDYQQRVQKIPFFGDIPLIGYLFRNTIRTQTKTNVYLFLTAHVLREPNFKDLNRLTHRDKMRLSKEELEDVDQYLNRYKEKNMTIDPEEGDHLYLLEYESPTEENAREDKE